VHGKLCVLTGGTSGIGRETAVALAGRGARLALVCRDRRRAEDTVAEIATRTGSREVSLHFADLSLQREVRRVAAELLACHPRIDVLVNNAGVVQLRHSLTPDGIETVFATNHLAYFLLTLLLLERLRASAPARIVNVASDAHRFGRMAFDDLGNAQRYRAMRVYGQSKLANVLFTYELARRLEGTGVTVNCLHPGAVATRLGHNNGAIARLLAGALRPFFRTPAQGAETSIWLASSPEVEHTTGGYFVGHRLKRSSPASYDQATARRLWDVSLRLTGLEEPTAARARA
jgi:NAD(P)-dependent dehydrogenase (short-subunit alcohol dehydrogenase family)